MGIDELKKELEIAMKRGDVLRRDTLRYLLSAVNNSAIAKYGAEAEVKLSEADVLDAVKKQVKTHRESIEAFEKGGRAELVEKEKAELVILENYLPKQMSDEELKAILEPIAKTGGEFGPMMGKAMAAAKGQADGARVAAILKQLL